MARERKREVSQVAVAFGELQNALPDARLVYASATAATESHNLAYASRLGLWGPGTAFANANDFVNKVEAGGVAAMELVARDMKAMGVYCARNLSFAGVEYDRLTHVLTEDQREIYDKLCEAWQYTLRNIEEALKVVCGGTEVDGKLRAAALSAYWGAHQRFYSSVITAMALPTVIIDIEKELAAGHSCVLQLVNTQEASMERALGALDEDDDLSDLDMTPRDQLIQMVEHCFPTQAQEMYVDEATGKEKFRPVVDSEGNPVRDAEAVEMRNRLLGELASIRCPSGPLEMLIDHFGPKNVAEVTGRSRRVVRIRENGSERTVIETRSAARAMAEAQEFQDGKRRILVFSDAGGTGQSYHAAANAKNQQRRIHFLLQAGWVADQAVQGFGRSHRSNQVSAPLYKLVSTDLKGQKRFISTVARRLDQLGALTKGQRDAASTGIFKASDNLESPWARQALVKLFKDIYDNKVPGLSVGEFERQTGLKIQNNDGSLSETLPGIPRFLNRLLSLKIAEQDVVFSHFETRLMAVIRKAADDGVLDLGCEVLRKDRITKVSEQVVYRHAESGAETKLVELRLGEKIKPGTFDDMMEQKSATYHANLLFFARNERSGRIYGFTQASDRTLDNGSVVPCYHQIGPDSRRTVAQRDIRETDYDQRTGEYKPRWRRYELNSSDMVEARQLWDEQVKQVPQWHESTVWLAVGSLLPIFDRLPQTNVKVRRLQISDTGERLLGRLIEESEIEDVTRRLGITMNQAALSGDQIAAKILAGSHTFELVNGWKLKRTRSGGENRIELVGPTYMHLDTLKLLGLTWERVDFRGHFWVPTGDRCGAILDALIKDKPVAQSLRLEKAA